MLCWRCRANLAHALLPLLSTVCVYVGRVFCLDCHWSIIVCWLFCLSVCSYRKPTLSDMQSSLTTSLGGGPLYSSLSPSLARPRLLQRVFMWLGLDMLVQRARPAHSDSEPIVLVDRL